MHPFLVTTYNILNEATIAGSPRSAWEALLAAFEGVDPWWAPYLVGRRVGPLPSGQEGSVMEIWVNTAGPGGGFWDRAHWLSRVIDVDPGRRIVLESIKGDFRGTIRLLLDPVGARTTRISLRFLGDPAGGLRWRAAFIDVPTGFRTVTTEGFRRLEQHLQRGEAWAA